MSKPDEEVEKLIGMFVTFLQEYGQASPNQQKVFLHFIAPQERADLIRLAEALREKQEKK